MMFGSAAFVGIGVRKHTSVPVNINSSYVSYESVEQSVGLVVRSSCPAGDQGALRHGCHRAGFSLLARHLVEPLVRLRAQGSGSPAGAPSGLLATISEQVAEEVSS